MHGTPLHFTTTNAPLAEALACVGFRLLHIWNRYTDATLDHLGVPDVATARAKGKPGAITYVFERRDDLDAALKAWDQTGEQLKSKEGFTVNVEAAQAMPLIRAVMHGHNGFRDLWKEVPAIFVEQFAGESKVEKTDHGTVATHPGFRAVSENVSEADRKRIFPE